MRGLQERLPELDIVRVQDTEMYQAADQDLLQWLIRENRILLTHDVRTMPGFFYELVRQNISVPGIIEVNREKVSIGEIIDQLELLFGASTTDEFENRVRYIPLP